MSKKANPSEAKRSQAKQSKDKPPKKTLKEKLSEVADKLRPEVRALFNPYATALARLDTKDIKDICDVAQHQGWEYGHKQLVLKMSVPESIAEQAALKDATRVLSNNTPLVQEFLRQAVVALLTTATERNGK